MSYKFMQNEIQRTLNEVLNTLFNIVLYHGVYLSLFEQ